MSLVGTSSGYNRSGENYKKALILAHTYCWTTSCSFLNSWYPSFSLHLCELYTYSHWQRSVYITTKTPLGTARRAHRVYSSHPSTVTRVTYTLSLVMIPAALWLSSALWYQVFFVFYYFYFYYFLTLFWVYKRERRTS